MGLYENIWRYMKVYGAYAGIWEILPYSLSSTLSPSPFPLLSPSPPPLPPSPLSLSLSPITRSCHVVLQLPELKSCSFPGGWPPPPRPPRSSARARTPFSWCILFNFLICLLICVWICFGCLQVLGGIPSFSSRNFMSNAFKVMPGDPVGAGDMTTFAKNMYLSKIDSGDNHN